MHHPCAIRAPRTRHPCTIRSLRVLGGFAGDDSTRSSALSARPRALPVAPPVSAGAYLALVVEQALRHLLGDAAALGRSLLRLLGPRGHLVRLLPELVRRRVVRQLRHGLRRRADGGGLRVRRDAGVAGAQGGVRVRHVASLDRRADRSLALLVDHLRDEVRDLVDDLLRVLVILLLVLVVLEDLHQLVHRLVHVLIVLLLGDTQPPPGHRSRAASGKHQRVFLTHFWWDHAGAPLKDESGVARNTPRQTPRLRGFQGRRRRFAPCTRRLAPASLGELLVAGPSLIACREKQKNGFV